MSRCWGSMIVARRGVIPKNSGAKRSIPSISAALAATVLLAARGFALCTALWSQRWRGIGPDSTAPDFTAWRKAGKSAAPGNLAPIPMMATAWFMDTSISEDLLERATLFWLLCCASGIGESSVVGDGNGDDLNRRIS